MRDWCSGTPSADLADGRRARAKFLIVWSEGDDFKSLTCVAYPLV